MKLRLFCWLLAISTVSLLVFDDTGYSRRRGGKKKGGGKKKRGGKKESGGGKGGGWACNNDKECASKHCVSKKCLGGPGLNAGWDCKYNDQCASNLCDNRKCLGNNLDTGSECKYDKQCITRSCIRKKCWNWCNKAKPKTKVTQWPPWAKADNWLKSQVKKNPKENIVWSEYIILKKDNSWRDNSRSHSLGFIVSTCPNKKWWPKWAQEATLKKDLGYKNAKTQERHDNAQKESDQRARDRGNAEKSKWGITD